MSRNSVRLRNLGGFVTNLQVTGERPLAMPGSVVRNDRHSFDHIEGGAKGVLQDPAYRDGQFSLDLAVVDDPRPGIFGDPRSSEDENSDTYDDLSASEMERRRKRLRAMLDAALEQDPDDKKLRKALAALGAGAETSKQVENLRAVPGFPLRSPLAD